MRDTMTWKRLPWQARLLIPAIMRKLDRSGVIDLGEDGEGGIADFIDVPDEFVQAGLPELLRREVFVVRGNRLVMPNYIAAQEARQSDAQRQRDSRERRAALGDKQAPTVTDGHVGEPDGTTCHQPSPVVTGGHTKSLQPSLAVPSRTEPEENSLRARARSNGGAKTAHDWLTFFGSKYWEKTGRPYGRGGSDSKALASLADLLTSLPDEQRDEDWNARDRIVDEFLARSDPRTTSAGWSFSFFANDFRALALPPDQRPGKPSPIEETKATIAAWRPKDVPGSR